MLLDEIGEENICGSIEALARAREELEVTRLLGDGTREAVA